MDFPGAPLPADEHAYAALVASFEDQSLPFEVWRHHRTHLIVAVYYLCHVPEAEALDRIRAGIHRILAANGIQSTPTNGYHETITRVWIRLLAAHLATVADRPLVQRAASALELAQDQQLLLRYYTEARLLSAEARAGWVEPDLAPLPA